MGTRRLWVALVVLLMPVGAYADDHWGDVMAAASGSYGSFLGGIQVTATKTIGHDIRLWNAIGEFNYQWGKDGLKQKSYFVGGRRTLVREPLERYLPFVQVLVGRAESHDPTVEGTHWALVSGLGIDILTNRENATGKYKETLLGFRLQGDWIASFSGEMDPYARVTLGIVIRFDENLDFLPLSPNPPPPSSAASADARIGPQRPQPAQLTRRTAAP